MIKIKNKTQFALILSPATLFVVGFFCFTVIALNQPKYAAAESVAYTCSTSGNFTTYDDGPARMTAADKASVLKSREWLKSMMKTRSVITTNSTIAPDESYGYDYQGPTRGTFTLSGRSYTKNDPNVIEVTSPAIIQDEYRGIVSGRVLTQPAQWRWIIQVYKKTATGTVMIPLQTLADGETGEFTLDLSSVDTAQGGAWEFGLLDADASYAPYGPHWPAVGTYNGLEVQELIATDTVYLWSTEPARTDGTFAFESVNTGTKLFRLVDSSTSDILAEHYNPTGLVRSYQYSPSDNGYGTGLEDQSFVYDQAITLFASLSGDDPAMSKLLTEGLLKMQTSGGQRDGGFVFAAPQLSPVNRASFYRTGAHAIAADALLAYIERYPSDPDIPNYKSAALRAMRFLESTRLTGGTADGLYGGGFGQYSGDPQVFDPAYTIPWASTEHNIDAWQTLIRAARIFSSPAHNFSDIAQELTGTIQEKLYSSATGRLAQGMQPASVDVADPLDVNTWGAIYMYASGHVERAKVAFGQLEPFMFTRSGVKGYAPFYATGGYPGAVENVWYEGSYGVALTAYRLGDYALYREIIDNLSIGQNSDGSFDYATDPDVTYEVGTAKSVAGTAWHILATEGRDDMWNSCSYTPPSNTEGGTTSPVTPPNRGPVRSPSLKKGSVASVDGALAQSESGESHGEGHHDQPKEINTEKREEPSSHEDSEQADSRGEGERGSSWSVSASVLVIGGVLSVGGLVGAVVYRRRRES